MRTRSMNYRFLLALSILILLLNISCNRDSVKSIDINFISENYSVFFRDELVQIKEDLLKLDYIKEVRIIGYPNIKIFFEMDMEKLELVGLSIEGIEGVFIKDFGDNFQIDTIDNIIYISSRDHGGSYSQVLENIEYKTMKTSNWDVPLHFFSSMSLTSGFDDIKYIDGIPVATLRVLIESRGKRAFAKEIKKLGQIFDIRKGKIYPDF